MEKCEVRFLREALDDLEEIVLRMARDSRAAALKLHDEIMRKTEELSRFPKIGRPVPNAKMRKAGYRMLLVKPYILFYRNVENESLLYRVIHGATNYPMLYEKMSQPYIVDELWEKM